MEYYIQYNGQTIGPMTSRQVAAYNVDKNTLVSANGGNWKPLYTFPELMEECARHSSAKPAEQDTMRIVCGVLAVLIGGFGLQYFLVGKTTGGIINILLTIVTCGTWSVVNLIQGIVILCMSDQAWREKYVDSTSTFPLF